MTILLCAINAKYIHSNLAVYSLRAFSGNYKEEIQIREYTMNYQEEKIMADIFRQKPKMLAFSCYVWNISMITYLIKEIHKILPNTEIWAGGPEVSYHAKHFLRVHPELKGIMRGEGEETFKELASYYIDGDRELSTIKGITYQHKGSILENLDREILSIDEIPFSYDNIDSFENRIIYYESSRGCPFSCSYCLSSIEKKIRIRNLELVKEELNFFIEKKVPQVKFVDRTFNCSHSHAMGVWKHIKAHDNGITNFHFEIGADLLTEEELCFLNSLRPGLVQLEIGVQSTNKNTIKEINRIMDFQKVAQAVQKIAKGNNIHQHLDLIAGLPYENYESFIQSFHDVYSLKPNQLQLGFLKVLKGSPMEEKAKSYGIVYREKPPYEVLYSHWLSYEDLLQLKAVEEMVELYYNSGQFTGTLQLLEKAFYSPYTMYSHLAVYYREKGYDVISSSRIRKYEILLDFALIWDRKNREFYEELLVFDLYSREKLKSRPFFAKDLTNYKECIRSFYECEEREPRYLIEYRGYNKKQMMRMTHLEFFTYNIEKFIKEGVVIRENQGMLFDYRKRNQWTNEAAKYVIQEKCCGQ